MAVIDFFAMATRQVAHNDLRGLDASIAERELANTLQRALKVFEAEGFALVKAPELFPADEWHEEIGDVLWWKFPIEEAPYIGSPLDMGHTVEAEVTLRRPGRPSVSKIIRADVGGWPGYHTHFTPFPPVPEPPQVKSKAWT